VKGLKNKMTKKSKIKEKISNKSKKNLPEKTKMKNEIKFTIMAVVLIAIFCVALTPVTLQNDTFYTIKIGEHIMQNGIDMQDPFSWHQDLAYTYPHWLYDVITYLIYNTFGMTGIYITTCILSVILGLTLFFTNKKLLKNQSISFIITIGVMYLIRGYIAARAQLVTFILFVLTIYFIERFLETKKKRYAVGLIIIPTLIANLHTAVFPFYFILYLPYIAEYIIAILAETIIYRKFAVAKLKFKIKIATNKNEDPEKIKQLREELKKLEEKIDKIKVKRTKELQNPYKIKLVKRDNCKWLILIMVICIFTGLLTPLGNTPYTYLQKTMQGNTTQNINEHLPMTLANDTEVVCTLVILLAILIFTKTKIRLCDLFMIGGLGYLMLMTKRQVTMFTLMGSFILNRLMLELIQTETKKDLKELTIQFNNLVTVPVMVVVTAVMLGLSYHMAEDKFDDQYVDESAYPVQACDYILENIDLGKAKFYNEYNYGSYMIFRGIPVFIDSRADLYAPEFSGKDEDIFMDFINTSNIGTFYEDTFEKYGITHVICYKNSKMNMIITKTHDSKFKELYSDKYFVVYERQTAEVAQ
jgi:ABC-type multidrug transport system fused ATPase/permease subunit